jgi:hypothetical protein
MTCRLVLFVGVACIFLSPAAKAQHNFFAAGDQDESQTFFAGMTLGANISQVDGDTYSGYHKMGLNAGAVTYARFSDHVGAGLEFLFVQKGSSNKNYTESAATGMGYLDEYKLKMNYVELPLTLRYFDNSRMNYGVGISYAYLISYKETAYDASGFPANLAPALYPFHKSDWAVLGDINFEFYKGCFIGARYAYSFRSIRDGSRIPAGYGGGRFGGQFHNLFSFRIFYFFP